MTISNKELAILGLLCEEDKHPYQIEKIIEERDMRHWTEISMSSIYKLLIKLERKHLVSSRKKMTEENRIMKIYSITNKGKDEMKNRVRKIISSWEKPKRPLDIALANLYLLDRDEAIACFRKYLASLDEMIICYNDLKKYLQKQCNINNVQLAQRPIHMLQAEKKWLINFLEEF